MNQTIFQFFHWYYPLTSSLWKDCSREAGKLAGLGISHVWLPPAYKSGKGSAEPGYAVYDTYDLGEFNQKGSVATRHGTKKEFLKCIKDLQSANISVLADIVLNHRFEGDQKELVKVVEVKDRNRKIEVSEEHTIEAATWFTFPGRNGKYSPFQWDHTCFTGLCDDGKVKLLIHEFSKAGWEDVPNTQYGNFDFLMANDVEFRNPAVRIELMRWGDWFVQTTGVDGFRLDGLKHIIPDFFPAWLDHLYACNHKSLFSIGEYWKNDVQELLQYIKLTSNRIRLVDVPLHVKLQKASAEKNFDMREIFKDTLVEKAPDSAVTFVDNHDTQPLQSLESPIEEWFQPLAHALILLRKGGMPCVFYPAIYGANYSDKDEHDKQVKVSLSPVKGLPEMLRIRRDQAYGDQQDFFEKRHLIGWTRTGKENDPGTGCAVVISTKDDSDLKMSMGVAHAGQMMYDVTGGIGGAVILDHNGEGVFPVKAKGVSVYIPFTKD